MASQKGGMFYTCGTVWRVLQHLGVAELHGKTLRTGDL